MNALINLSQNELKVLKEDLTKLYEEYKAKGLKLDMSRGKPGADQLDITTGLLTVISSEKDCYAKDGTDCRNYGGLDGIPEAKALFAEISGVTTDEILVGGNSSLNMMFDTIARAM